MLFIVLLVMTDAPRIYGSAIRTDKKVNIEDYPYQLSLRGSHGYHLCSATILGEKLAVTAAQCLRDQLSYSVKAGVSTLSKSGAAINVERVLSHPNFTEMHSGYDIALLFLASPLTFSKKIQPVKLPTQGVKEGTSGRVSGWDTMDYWNRKLGRELRAIELKVHNWKKCSEEYEWLSDASFCTGLSKEIFSLGDGGAPFVSNGVLYGVVSWSEDTYQPRQLGVYVDVYKVKKFIKENASLK